jgi:outer membrane protein OmpA-like peptidoglycan-associated protein
VLALLAAPAAMGQPGSATSTTGETGLFTLFTAETLPQGDWSFGLYYNNWDRVFEFDDNFDLDWHQVNASLGWGITDRFELAVSLPYLNLDPDFDGALGGFGDDDSESGIGNVRVGGKWRLSGVRPDGGTAIHAFVEAPTGDEEVLAGDTGFGAGFVWSNTNWAFNATFRAPGDIDLGGGQELAVSEEVIVGLGHVTSISDNLDWITELVGTVPVDSDEAIFQESVDLATGGRLWFGETGNWAFNFGLRTDLLQLGDTDRYCPIGGLLGLTYFPRFVEEPPPAPPPPPPPPPVVPPPPPPEPAPVLPQPAPEPPREERVTVQFDANSARLTNIAKAKLDEVALKMKEDPDITALVVGYTDSQGSTAANQTMSERRAQAVKDYLVSRHGIDPSRIQTEGRGSADPVASNDTAEGRAQNRRAVVILTIPP